MVDTINVSWNPGGGIMHPERARELFEKLQGRDVIEFEWNEPPQRTAAQDQFAPRSRSNDS